MTFRTTPSVVVRLLLWVLLLVGGAWLAHRIDRRFFDALWENPLWHLSTLPIGLALMWLAFRAAAAGGRALSRGGRSSPDVPRLETDRLVTEGIYAHMRHPMLFGLTLLPLAFAFCLGSPAFITMVAPIEMLLIVIMVMTLEEWECRKKFGTAYEKYADKVPAVCLSKECLKKLLFEH